MAEDGGRVGNGRGPGVADSNIARDLAETWSVQSLIQIYEIKAVKATDWF